MFKRIAGYLRGLFLKIFKGKRNSKEDGDNNRDCQPPDAIYPMW
jgi:hypothetical protein